MALTRIKTDGITDGSILNADINASAAIALSKLSTSGTASSSTYLRGDGAWSTVASGVSSDSYENTIGGTSAGSALSGSSDAYNTFFGYHAGKDSSSTRSTAVGSQALKTNSTGLNNTAIGASAFASTTASYNTGLGANVGKNTSTGSSNTFIGSNAGFETTIGGSNTALGGNALFQNTEGQHNTAVGGTALYTNSTSSGNTALGYEAGKASTGQRQVFVGYQAGKTIAGENGNVVIGYQALDTGVGGSGSTIIGDKAGREISDGNNTIIGSSAGSGATTLTHGSNNILIGAGTNPSSATVDNEITLGNDDITKFRIPGINFVVKDTTATEDYVLTVDANGEAGWEAAAGGAGGATGTDYDDNVAVRFGAGYDLTLRSNGTSGYIQTQHSGGTLYFGTTSSDNLMNISASGISFLGETHWTNGNDINLNDSSKIIIGTGDDLELHSDGENGHLTATQGNLWLRSDTNIFLSNEASNEYFVKATHNGAVELYYDHSKKLETSSSGVHLNDSVRLTLGGSTGTPDFQIYHDGLNSYLEEDGTGQLIIRGWGPRLQAGYSPTSSRNSGEDAVVCVTDGAVELYYNAVKKFETYASGSKVHGAAYIDDGYLLFDKGNSVKFHRIVPNDSGNDLGFQQSASAGTDGSYTTYLRIKNGGDVALPVDSKKLLFGAGEDLEVWSDGINGVVRASQNRLFVQGQAGVNITNNGNTEEFIICDANGAVELYYDNAKKCETTTNGLSIAANNDIRFNNGNWTGDSYGKIQHHDNRIYFGIGSNGIIFRESGTNRWEIDGNGHFIPAANDTYDIGTASNRVGNLYTVDVFASGNVDLEDAKAVKLGTDDDFQLHHTSGINYIDCYADLLIRNETSETMIDCNRNGKVELYYDGDKRFETDSQSINVFGDEGESCHIYMSADQADDQPDQWRLKVDHTASSFYLQNYAGGNWDHTNIKANGGGEVELYHNNSMKMETNANGISVDGNIGFVSAGQGIDFGATANAGGGSSNRSELFDDYEEGQWEPSFSDGSGHIDGSMSGHRYVKVGAMVTVWGNIRTNSSGTSGTAPFYITGLPFTSANYSNVHYLGPLMGDNGWDEDLSDSNLQSFVYSNSGNIRLWKNSGDSVGSITLNNIGNSANVNYCVSYMAA